MNDPLILFLAMMALAAVACIAESVAEAVKALASRPRQESPAAPTVKEAANERPKADS